jgi:hypothetical protein
MNALTLTHVITVAAFAACFTAGCAKPDDGTPAAGTQVLVVGGMKNQVFEAESGQRIMLTEGTVGTPVTDQGGTVKGISIARDNAGGIDVSCACPAGCSEGDGTPGGAGCIVGIQPGGKDASCGGSCSAPNQSCMACSFSFEQPGANDVRANWVRRTDLVLSPNP